jgi:threonine/homoserine efflux transporter RhtA
MMLFDLAPIAAVSLDMTAALAPLLYGLCGLVGVSALGIMISALLPRLTWERRTTEAVPTFFTPAHRAR